MKHLINKVINYFSFSKNRYYYYSREVYDERYMIDFHDDDDKIDYENGKTIYEWKFGNLNGTPVKDIQHNCEELVSGQIEWFFDIHPGIVFFPDFNNFSDYTHIISDRKRLNITDNKPVLTFYKYIGTKGIHNIA